jgi:arginine N-succinyltransferase
MTDNARYLLRPSTPADLPAFERMADSRAIGITSLPTDRAALRDRLERSAHAFESADDASGEEIYLFVLEDRAHGGAVIGTRGIAAAAGFNDRFYCYRNEFTVHASPALGARNRIHTLHLCHDLTGVTLLTGFYIDPAYEDTAAPQLLSRGRLLFVSQFADRFCDRIAAENPGLADETGRCPFWDAVGRRFFDMDFSRAETLTGHGRHRSLIADLMPQTPIYVPLLPEETQFAIGQLHPVAELPFSILQDEGFDAETYVNIFDGGPTVEARLAMLRSVRHAQAFTPGHKLVGPHLVANADRRGFRALLAETPSALSAADLRLLRADGAAPLMATAL